MSESKKDRRVGLRPFAEVIVEMSGGDVEKELTQQLGELVRACDAYKKAGSMSIKLLVSPGPKTMQIAAEIKTTLPRKPIDAQQFFCDEQGSLTLDNPRQTDLFSGPRSIIPIKPEGEN